MNITKYRVYFDSSQKELGYVEHTSPEGLSEYEIITEEIPDE
jgi:hypothetical protein